ncbi:helix-turn-helix domain-containing protein [Escherichia coli]|nr:helix-turn-helix domain-containing protein [Escherichia coli]
MNANVERQIMTIKDVCELLNRSRTAVYVAMKRYPDFPEPMSRGHGVRMVWLKSELIAWYEQHKDELEESRKNGMIPNEKAMRKQQQKEEVENAN